MILEKIEDNKNAQKLWAILLLEDYFNAIYKIIFNNRLYLYIEVVNSIPIEVMGERRPQAAIHLALDKKLISNIVKVWKLPVITVCANTINYYNRVAYLFTSLCAQYSWVEVIYLAVLFRAIHWMKIFL